MDALSALLRVRVYPLGGHNIDRAALCTSKLRPCSCNIGRQTGGSMSMQGAHRPITAAVPAPAGRVLMDSRQYWGMRGGQDLQSRVDWVIPSALKGFKGLELELGVWWKGEEERHTGEDYQAAQGPNVFFGFSHRDLECSWVHTRWDTCIHVQNKDIYLSF